MAHLNFGYLDWIAKQGVPFTSSGEFLFAWAAMKKIFQNPAQAAVLTVSLPGTPGTPLNINTSLSRSDSTTYTVLATVTVGVSGFAVVQARADVPGTAGNAAPGTLMSLGISIPGIQSSGTVTGTVTTGGDQETEKSVFNRMMAAYQSTPNGGSFNDYVNWALAVPGVTRAWCTPNGFGTGTVVVFVMLDNANAPYQGFPQGTNGISVSDNRATSGNLATGDQLVVANSIFPLQPVTAMVYICAALPNPTNFTITGLTNASTITRAAIAAAITEIFVEQGVPKSDGSISALSDIDSAIAAIASTSGFVITSPVANIPNIAGYLPTLGVITFP
ncbi:MULTISPECIES: baseplate J/gp47 family protein [unclassified Pseudomonas]|uniref:baseplate J/gp47 family protein n=2 Tax=Pseudomonas TaxID=286 RepID=UPI002B23925B|nr:MULTISPECIES: baseplate J/gp47 family protein [unclassified Pseudomonas]MEA9997043.1 baseplate J/gp47 family protein [Pseudomonas sp. AA4]MEB0089233.1 baseplate J/gp47 family protein [Pseudomonas sp. RTI1]MEB0128425.1 baseplate J/gp47 family protein [Pseudomonas sp. CCC1.2]MEB0155323.1 baseplate J/gp47 family protein [Pseudomonas sp. CCC4.3]MEB0221691.1 baseplate J/gp47 family protein [Pseudomonas sp. AB12(2023)]